ncbi:holin [Glutamicibacter arilaitensis]|uniref:holin n=1 Tax=Glutamicibacter arilaitensis TaxID=256701 RepID=UPI003F8F4307
MFILTRAFWLAAGDRAIRTFAQAAVAVLTAAGVGILDADLAGAASSGLLAALISVLTSIATPNQVNKVEPARHLARPEDLLAEPDAR